MWSELLKTFRDPASFTVIKDVKPTEKDASEEREEEGEDVLLESREQ